jgi:hypothetical protein
MSYAWPYKPWAGVQHRMVTQDLPCNHTMAKTSRLNVEQRRASRSLIINIDAPILHLTSLALSAKLD